MMNDLLRTSAETTTSDEGSRKRTDNHVDLRGIDVLVLCKTATVSAKDTEGPSLVENQAELVLEFQFNLETNSQLSRKRTQGETQELTRVGRSLMSPRASKRPSVMMKRLVKGFFFCSSTTLARTRARSSISLCSYHRTMLREIWIPLRRE